MTEDENEYKTADSKANDTQSELNNACLRANKKKKWTMEKIFKTLALFAILAFVWIGTVQYLAADKYSAVVKVQKENKGVGVNPTTEKLDFGDLPKGDGLTRFITIENGGKMDVYVKIIKTGSIADLIEVSRNNFVLSSDDSAKIEFSLEMPISADKEGYEGRIIIFKLPKL